MPAIRPANSYQSRAIDRTLELLHEALAVAHIAKCPRACGAIRYAIASANGARRHMVARRRAYGVLQMPAIPRKYRYAYAD